MLRRLSVAVGASSIELCGQSFARRCDGDRRTDGRRTGATISATSVDSTIDTARRQAVDNSRKVCLKSGADTRCCVVSELLSVSPPACLLKALNELEWSDRRATPPSSLGRVEDGAAARPHRLRKMLADQVMKRGNLPRP